MKMKAFLDKWAAIFGFAGGLLALLLVDPQSESYSAVVAIGGLFFLGNGFWLLRQIKANESKQVHSGAGKFEAKSRQRDTDN